MGTNSDARKRLEEITAEHSALRKIYSILTNPEMVPDDLLNECNTVFSDLGWYGNATA